MATKQTRARQKRAASYVAGLILDSLDQFPKEERSRRLRDVHKALKVSSGKRD